MSYAGNEQHLRILKESLAAGSAKRWNRWRKEHPRVVPDLRGVILPGKWLRFCDFSRAKLDDAILERCDLAGARLERASLQRATLRLANLAHAHGFRVNLSGADLRDAVLRGGDFRKAISLDEALFDGANLADADFSGARMAAAHLEDANLTNTKFDGADLTRAYLSRAILDGTSLLGAKLRNAMVHQPFIRGVRTDARTDQRSLDIDIYVVWDRPKGSVVEFAEADDIRLAQFHGIFEEHGAITSLLNASARRVVLILGRFTPKRKRVLQRLADALAERGKVPVIYDFPSPEDREISDTVRFIAALSQFIVVDMTDASSVPLELQATIPDLMVPVLPIIEAGKPLFAMFTDLQRRYSWIQPTVKYRDAGQLVKWVDQAILQRAELAAEQLRKQRASAVRPPMSVSSLRARPSRRS